MKNTMALLGIGLAAVLFSPAAFAQKAPEAKEAKSQRHIKMMKIENGKKMELDTVLTGDDVFVWHGDTINPVKHAGKLKASDSGEMQHIDVEVENEDGRENVMIFKHKGGKSGEPMSWKMDSGDNVQVFTDDEGDSLQKKIVIRKRMKDGKDLDHFIYTDKLNHENFPPMPPHLEMRGRTNQGRMIDLNDPNIVSYKKKEMKNGLEKIEIIRKKPEGPENSTFDFNVDNNLMPPPPPKAPEIIRDFKDGHSQVKIVRKQKKLEGKDGKETEVEPKENK